MNELGSLLESLEKLSPSVALVLGINVICFMVKRLTSIPSKKIPAVAILCGGIAYPFIAKTSNVPSDIPYPIVHKIVIGLLLGGAATGVHQAMRPKLKQWFGIDLGDTEMISRSSDIQAVKEAEMVMTEATKDLDHHSDNKRL